MQKPLEPEESMKHMHLPEGFEVQLFASEPDIYRPICMAWDARGRLWIAETVDYPNNMQPPGKGHDRIVILEDTKGTGRADKFTVFADHLSIPTSMTFANGGVIVTQAPDMLFLKDTNGDDKADVRETLFSGWGTCDTHAGPSNLRYGFDNWIWGTVGYSGFNGKIGGKETQVRPGRLPHEARRHGTGIPDDDEQQHLGPRLERVGRGLRLDGQQRTQRLSRRTESLFRGACAVGTAPAARASRTTRKSIRSRIRSARWIGTAAITAACGARALHGPQFPEGVLEQGGVRLRADGASGPR